MLPLAIGTAHIAAPDFNPGYNMGYLYQGVPFLHKRTTPNAVKHSDFQHL